MREVLSFIAANVPPPPFHYLHVYTSFLVLDFTRLELKHSVCNEGWAVIGDIAFCLVTLVANEGAALGQRGVAENKKEQNKA